MPPIIQTSTRRALWLASTVLIPLSPFATPGAHAQQSASPDLLPPVEVSPPKPAGAPQPAVKPKQNARQAAAKPTQQKPPEPPATPKPGVAAQ